MRFRSVPAYAFVAMTIVACGGGSDGGAGNYNDSGNGGPTSPSTPNTPAPPPANTVLATPSNTFTPSPLSVTVGTSVTFTFQGVGHNVFFDAASGAPANIPDILSNTSVSRTFSAAGSFGYECHVHQGMRGTIVVQ